MKIEKRVNFENLLHKDGLKIYIVDCTYNIHEYVNIIACDTLTC